MLLKNLRPIASNEKLLVAINLMCKADFDYSRSDDAIEYRKGQQSVELYIKAYDECSAKDKDLINALLKKETNQYNEVELAAWLLATKDSYTQFHQVLRNHSLSIVLYAAKHNLVRFEADQLCNYLLEIENSLKDISKEFPNLSSMTLNLNELEIDNSAKKNMKLSRAVHRLKMQVKFYLKSFSTREDSIKHFKIHFKNASIDKGNVKLKNFTFILN